MTNTRTASFVATLGVAGASAVAATGLMLMLVALGAMSVTWMLVLAAVITAQKVLPPRAAVDVSVALGIVAVGISLLPL
ncbi:MAG: DUF2182 domain-containing protein [Actinobacteria bacterium]|nr:MAG: DUF2182 domain-containing protein [Actinomycetota bacterium]